MKQRNRIRKIVEKWFLAEPLLFAAWTTHALTCQPQINTIRVRQGQIEYNPEFLQGLTPADLEQVMKFETLRILLKHPYSRQQEQAQLTYLASNMTLQEALQSSLPFPYAKDVFGSDEFNQQYLEFYYNKLTELASNAGGGNSDDPAEASANAGGQHHASSGGHSDNSNQSEPQSPARPIPSQAATDWSGDGGEVDKAVAFRSNLTIYTDAQYSGLENTADWAENDLLTERLEQVIESALTNQRWGCVAGHLREQILATLQPKLDYRAVLRQFRASVLSTRRVLTRMKPSRRYGFAYLGSRREFDTRLLFAVDVSGSMSHDDLRQGFSIINRFFQYGISSIDVVHFDTMLRGKPITFKQASHEVEIEGRGGTNFVPVLAYIDKQRDYDGLIIFTDGYCSAPPRPNNRHTRILWLFTHESTYRESYAGLRHLGAGAFIRANRRV